MAKKRQKRSDATQITPQAVETFTRAYHLRDHREQQLADGDACPGRGRCEKCDEYEAHVIELDRLLGLAPHEQSPLDVMVSKPPPWFNAQAAAAWTKASGFRTALREAAGLPDVKMDIFELSRPQRNIRWTERHCHVPEGPDVGRPVRLREWQRDEIRRIYGPGDLGTDIMDEGECKRVAEAIAGGRE